MDRTSRRRFRRIALHAAVAFAAAACAGCPPGGPPVPAGPPRLAPSGIAALERALVRQCAQARLDRRVPPADADAALSALARRQAESLAARGRISHFDADGGDYRARLADPSSGLGLAWRDAGEILARNRAPDPAAEAVRGWLVSPAHAQTLLDPRYRRLGVGAAQDADGTYYLVALWLD